MNDSMRYSQGDWFVIARERGLAVLPPTVPTGILDPVWNALEAGSLSHVIEALTVGTGLALPDLPPFAIAIVDDDGIRIAVRGDVRVASNDGSRHDIVTGGHANTWVEQVVPDHAALVVTPPDTRDEGASLPLASGVVRGGVVSMGFIEEPVSPIVRRTRRRAPLPVDAAAVADGAVADHLSDSQIDAEFAALTDRDFGDGIDESFSDHDGQTIDQAHAGVTRDPETAALVDEVIALADSGGATSHAMGRVVLSTGPVLTLERVLVLGRRPRWAGATGVIAPALVTVDSPTHDISRNHIEIRREGDTVLVTDLNTTNGTLLLRGQEVPRRLHPGDATLVVNGDVVDIGDGVTITFEDLP